MIDISISGEGPTRDEGNVSTYIVLDSSSYGHFFDLGELRLYFDTGIENEMIKLTEYDPLTKEEKVLYERILCARPMEQMELRDHILMRFAEHDRTIKNTQLDFTELRQAYIDDYKEKFPQ